jgi:hypothetical protein
MTPHSSHSSLRWTFNKVREVSFSTYRFCLMVDYAPGEPEEEPPLEMTLEEQPVTKATSESVADIGRVKTLSWLSQLSVVLHKNLLLLWRRPVMFSCMLLSSVFSVILAITVGQDVEFDKVVVTACGTVDDNYYRSFDDSNDYTAKYNIPLSYNENWRSGLAVTLMGKWRYLKCWCFASSHNHHANATSTELKQPSDPWCKPFAVF